MRRWGQVLHYNIPEGLYVSMQDLTQPYSPQAAQAELKPPTLIIVGSVVSPHAS